MMHSRKLLSITRLSTVILMILSISLALSLGQASARDPEKDRTGDFRIPELGTLYAIDLNGETSISTRETNQPVSAYMLLEVSSVKTSGVPNISITLIEGYVTVGDETSPLSHGTSSIAPVNKLNMKHFSEVGRSVLTVFADLVRPLPISEADSPVKLIPSLNSRSAEIQINNEIWYFNYFSGDLRISPPVVGEAVGVSDTETIDALGGRIEDFFVGQQMLFQSVLSNNLESPQDFAYIVQITDSDDLTIQLSWMQGTLNPGQSITVAQSWLAEDRGIYDVQVLVWDSMASPTPLTSGVDTLEIEITK